MYHYFELIWFRARAELHAEASRAYTGMLWWIIEPVLYMAAFYFIFAVGFRGKNEDFVPFLLCGLVPWKWFSSMIMSGARCITANRALIQQVYLPKIVLLGIALVISTRKFLIILALLLLFLLVYGIPPSTSWFGLPLIMLVQMLLMLAIAGAGAVIMPFFPDIKLIIDNGLLVLFFLSGIFFEISSTTETVQQYLMMNPVAVLINAYRDVLLTGSWPDWGQLMITGILSSVVIALVWMALVRFDRVYPKIVS